MSEVVAAVKHVSGLMAGIADATIQQSAGIHEVNQTLAVMEQVTQQNAALVEETSAAVQLFEEEVDKLQEMVNHFKLDRADGRQIAVALVRQGVEHIKAIGMREACDDFDDPKGEFIFGEYYLWVATLNGIRLANGSDPASRGQNMLEIHENNLSGAVRKIIDKARAKGKGWQDYKWFNPMTRQVQTKSCYFELVDGAVVTCGIYYKEVEAAVTERPVASATRSLPPAKSRRRTH
jgi:signal transduction histidine kinase